MPMVALLWAGCMQHWVLAGLGIFCACVGFRRRPTQQALALAMVLTGWVAQSLYIHYHPHLTEPLTNRWSCQPATSRSAIRLLECKNEDALTYVVEWKEKEHPAPQPFIGTLWPFRSSRPSLVRWKRRHGIEGVLRPTVDFCPSASSPNIPHDAKTWLWHRLQNHFSGEVPGLLFAITSGDKHHLTKSLKQTLNHAGLSHLMAVSGYHVGLVASLAVFLLRRRKQGFRWLGGIGLFGAWAFIAFCGWPDSAVRAGAMLTFYGISQISRSNQPAEHALALAGWWMLLCDPARSVDLGMQLSFLAVLAILTTIRVLQRCGKSNPIWMYLLIPISAQWGTGLVAWPQFQLFPVHFLWFNLLTPPLMMVIGMMLATMLICEAVLDTSCWMEPATYALDRALLWVLEGMKHLQGPGWTLNLERADPEWLVAFSLLFWAGGLSLVHTRIELWRAFRRIGAGIACIVPLLAWQLEHRIQLSYRYGMVLQGEREAGVVWTENKRDSTAIARKRARANDAPGMLHVLSNGIYQKASTGDWMLSFQTGSGIGQQKNCPIAWKRTGGSEMRFILGSDTVELEQWAETAVWDLSSNEGGW